MRNREYLNFAPAIMLLAYLLISTLPDIYAMRIIDFYALLGIPRNADPDTIKKRYRELCKKYHPDTNPNGTDADKQIFQQLQDANEILKDPAKREEYDQQLREEEIKSIAAAREAARRKSESISREKQRKTNTWLIIAAITVMVVVFGILLTKTSKGKVSV